MDRQRIPLIRDAGEITAEWLRQALAAGGAAEASEITEVEVEQLSDVTNALGNLYRCRLIARGGEAADPASVIVKLPSANALAIRFARWLSLHRRRVCVLPGYRGVRLRAGADSVLQRFRPAQPPLRSGAGRSGRYESDTANCWH